MNDYLLFIDTEASGLPKNWNLPYDTAGNWPHCVQISWVIFSRDGNEIKEEDHYVGNNDFEIAESAVRIHGITRKFLNENGEQRRKILAQLSEDVTKYKPLIVGHFMQFDLHMLAADFLREGLVDPVKREDTFCTMLGSTHLIKNPAVKFLRLEQLYQTLFDKILESPHNALVDAKATALCFFELMKRGEIGEEVIKRQQYEIAKKDQKEEIGGCLIPMIILIVTTFIIFYL